MKKVIGVLGVLFLVSQLNTACLKKHGASGTKDNPIKMYFMPLKGEEAFKTNSPVIKKFLEDETGLAIRMINAPDFISIVRAFDNGQADIAFMNTLGYLMARDMSKVEARLVSIYSDIYKTYRGEIVAKVEGPISAGADLNGKTIAFADPFSSSGYLYALKYLTDNNIKPSQTVFAKGHKDALEMLLSGKVDAAAVYYSQPSPDGAIKDARFELAQKYPDILVKLKIIATTDEIPNGPVAMSEKLPNETKEKLEAALLKFAQTVEGRKVLNDLYNITGLTPVNGAVYDSVGAVIRRLGKTVDEMVPGGVTFYKQNISPLLKN